MKNDNLGIYLPISPDENMEKKTALPRNGRLFRHPHLIILLLFSCLSIFIMISMFLFSSGKRGELAESGLAPSPLVLISIDGFRYDYLRRGKTPNLLKLCKKGIYGPMRPQFPSYTFPNHYSLVTGLYPESHGIVGNSFYDPEIDDYFSFSDPENLKESKWWQAEPIWNTIQKNGLKSATMFWPGSESKIFGKRPNFFRKYNENVKTRGRFDQVLKWLDMPSSIKPNFISMYLSLVDDAGHLYGPNSKELDDALGEIDLELGIFLKQLKERRMEDSINLLIVSDHGMVEIKNQDRFHVYLEDFIPRMNDRVRWIEFGPMASIIPLPEEEDSILSELRRAQMQGHPIKVFKRDDIPEKFHFNKNVRIAPIIVMAKKGYVIDFHGTKWAPRGAHGYDPNLPEMQAILIGTGPQFNGKYKGSHLFKRISNLDVYPLMMHLLKVEPSPNNGTMALVNLIK